MNNVRCFWITLALISLPAISQSTFALSHGQSSPEFPLDTELKVVNYFNGLSTPHPFIDSLGYSS